MKCQKCGIKVNDDAKFCPKCGSKIMHKQKNQSPTKIIHISNKLIYAILISFALFIVFMIFFPPYSFCTTDSTGQSKCDRGFGNKPVAPQERIVSVNIVDYESTSDGNSEAQLCCNEGISCLDNIIVRLNVQAENYKNSLACKSYIDGDQNEPEGSGSVVYNGLNKFTLVRHDMRFDSRVKFCCYSNTVVNPEEKCVEQNIPRRC